jgi:hypothetical protein
MRDNERVPYQIQFAIRRNSDVSEEEISMKKPLKLSVALLGFAIASSTLGGVALGKPSLAPSVSTPEQADSMIVIMPKTKSVHVFENDTVLFKVGDKVFAIKFDGDNVYYNLETLAPPGVLTRKVRVYVAPNPKEHGQGIP